MQNDRGNAKVSNELRQYDCDSIIFYNIVVLFHQIKLKTPINIADFMLIGGLSILLGKIFF